MEYVRRDGGMGDCGREGKGGVARDVRKSEEDQGMPPLRNGAGAPRETDLDPEPGAGTEGVRKKHPPNQHTPTPARASRKCVVCGGGIERAGDRRRRR